MQMRIEPDLGQRAGHRRPDRPERLIALARALASSPTPAAVRKNARRDTAAKPCSSAALPAKLSPPLLHDALPRARLFDWLDARRDRAAVWLSGAPGSGKTMLAASYIEARRLPAVWIRLGAGDNDIGRFFATLGQALTPVAGTSPLPPFFAEHCSQPEAFARRWFRSFYSALPKPCRLVLTDVEQACMPALPLLLKAALDEAPEQVQWIITCCHAPPAELEAALSAGKLVRLPEADLAFDREDAVQYARMLGLPESKVVRAARRAGGWAAGLRLLTIPGVTLPGDAEPQRAFDRVAGKLFDRLDAPVQRLLQLAALPPWTSADTMAELSGVADAEAQLERLGQHNLFVERIGRGAYRLHPLLREFLRGRTADAPERKQWLRRMAAAFVERMETDAAIDLTLDAGDAAQASVILVHTFEARLVAGRLDQLEAWCRRLGDAALDAEPFLRYALARASFLREDAAALDRYARACEAFAAHGDLGGQQLCAAGVLECARLLGAAVPHRRWCDLLLRPLSDAQVPALEVHALRLLDGRLLADLYQGEIDRAPGPVVDDVMALIAPGGAENEKLALAITLLDLFERRKHWSDARLLATRVEALIDAPGVRPRLAILVRQRIAADLLRRCGEYAAACRLALAARTHAREQGHAALEYEALAILLLAALYAGVECEAKRLLADLGATTDRANVYHQRFAACTHAWHELQCGRLVKAREHAEALRAAVARSDLAPRSAANWLLVATLVRFAGGDEDGACDELEAASGSVLRANLLALRAWRELRLGTDAGTSLLREAFTLCESMRYHALLPPLRKVLAELAACALERGIAPAFTHELIERRRLVPPSPAALQWPWALRIRTLGAFTIEAGGELLVFPGKAPRKPLALLKALIALGPHPVAEAELVDALWPEDDAGAAHAALNAALHRLRKLLPDGGRCVQLSEGRLGLDANAVWVDCQAFTQLDADSAASPLDADRAALLLRRVLDVYRGRFLSAESDEPWSVSMRERLRVRCSRLVGVCAQALADAGRHQEAIDAYNRGLELDDLDEAFHQGVMRCAASLGRRAEGIAAWLRCKRRLALALGVAPSAQTEELRRKLETM